MKVVPNRNTKNAVDWTRVSTSRQEKDGGSLDYQKKVCKDYAERNGLNIVGSYGGTHESAKVPGKLFKEMINDVKKDKSISKVICPELDRFSRDASQAIKIIRELYEMGVSVVSVKQGIETSTYDNIMVAAMMLNLANWDNDKRADKFYSGRKHCYESGAYTGVLPRGYYREGKSLQSVCKLNDEGRMIAKAFRWKLEGCTNSEILDKLRVLGLVITKQSLNHYFNNPFYAGKIQSIMLDGGMVDGHIEQAVSYADWLEVQKIMSGKSGKYKHKKKQEKFPLKNFVRCADCGTTFTAYTVKSRNKDYYKCNKIGCGTNVSAPKLHDSYVKVLRQLELPMDLVAEYEDTIRCMLKVNDDENVKYATMLKKQRTEKEKELANCKRRFAVGQLTDEDLYKETISIIQEEIAKLDAELEKYQENLSIIERKVHDIIVTCSKLSDLWETSDLDTKQRIQKLTFPKGIFWDNEKRDYRTNNRNEVFDVLDRISGGYKKTNGEKPHDFPPLVSLCAG
jgi:DNA invertase Pin-like site-specific DNA recombinase